MACAMRPNFSHRRVSAGTLLPKGFAEVEQRIHAIRKVLRGLGIDLDRKQAVALAGEWYKSFVARHEEDQGDPVAYDKALWDIIEAMREFAPDEVREHPLKDMEWARDPEVRAGVRPIIADLGCPIHNREIARVPCA
jgi:hypothetical protein